jgi:hypothetical protein
MIMAAPPSVGSEAISEPTNGPLRSTAHRGRHHDGRRHRDLQQQTEQENRFGRHGHFAIDRWRTK